MSFYDDVIALLNKIYRDDPYIKSLIAGVNTKVEFLDSCLDELKANFFFNTLNEDGCKYFESMLAITPRSTQTIPDRRASIQAKWNSNNHNDIELIQKICDAWKNGEINADFVGGKIKITFVGELGVPDDLESLKSAIEEIKPAHLAYLLMFKYLLIENIHEVKTIEEMEELTIEQFAFGIE